MLNLVRPYASAVINLFSCFCVAIYAYFGVWLPLHSGGYDFTGPYEAAYALARHAPLQVYDVAAQRVYNRTVLHLPQGPSDFRWTPPSAALLIPLTLFPYMEARILWWGLSQVALFIALWLLARCTTAAIVRKDLDRLTSPSVWRIFLILLCASALMQSVTDSLRLGQSTTFLLLGFAMIAYGEVFDRQMLSGVGLGIAILDKLFPAALIVFFLWRGRYLLCITASCLITFLILITIPVTGARIYSSFAHALQTYSGTPNAGPVNLSLYHALIVVPSALLRPHQSEPTSGVLQVLATLICISIFGVLLYSCGAPAAFRGVPCMSRYRNCESRFRSRNDQFFATSWATCSLLLLEPIVWIFYYILLLVSMAWLLSLPDLESNRLGVFTRQKRPFLVALVAYAVATVPLPLDSRTAPLMGFSYCLGICVRPAAALGLWIAHVFILRANHRKLLI